MKLAPFIAAAAAMVLTQPASAMESQSKEQKTAKADKSAERVVCRSVERVGSNIKDRICLTREKWKQVDEYLRTGDA